MPDITAYSSDGQAHVFPDGTDPGVIDKVIRDYTQRGGIDPPETQARQRLIDAVGQERVGQNGPIISQHLKNQVSSVGDAPLLAGGEGLVDLAKTDGVIKAAKVAGKSLIGSVAGATAGGMGGGYIAGETGRKIGAAVGGLYGGYKGATGSEFETPSLLQRLKFWKDPVIPEVTPPSPTRVTGTPTSGFKPGEMPPSAPSGDSPTTFTGNANVKLVDKIKPPEPPPKPRPVPAAPAAKPGFGGISSSPSEVAGIKPRPMRLRAITEPMNPPTGESSGGTPDSRAGQTTKTPAATPRKGAAKGASLKDKIDAIITDAKAQPRGIGSRSGKIPRGGSK